MTTSNYADPRQLLHGLPANTSAIISSANPLCNHDSDPVPFARKSNTDARCSTALTSTLSLSRSTYTVKLKCKKYTTTAHDRIIVWCQRSRVSRTLPRNYWF
uniref:MSP domain-containing protein n=1 Tax=Mesocestoides corti TaxID=53468 RepID=A0A5K3FP20_MESCO